MTLSEAEEQYRAKPYVDEIDGNQAKKKIWLQLNASIEHVDMKMINHYLV